MVQSTSPTEQANIDDLKNQIRRLNSKAGQLKMDLHDLAEALPANYEQLMNVAAQTYAVFRTLNEMKQQLKTLEK
ncbi:MAG: CCE_0567 family metalloprotein [Oculatellaceae cyanobacterium bins.114]|nr:CCE_0567 family metalloprotein [Oculatellaceae cyanobacterium bins.114]